MRKMFILLLAVTAWSCSPSPDESAIKSAIEGANTSFMKAISEGNADAVAAIYSEDCMLMAPNMATLSGRDGVKQYMQHGIASGITAIKLITEEVNSGTDFALERGRYEVVVGGSMKVDEGKYLVEWKKSPNGWQIYRDIMNSDLAAPRVVAKSGEDVWVVNYHVKAGKGKEFEDFVKNTLVPAIDQSNAKQSQAIASTRLLLPKKADAKGVLHYAFLMDPVVSGADYSIDKLLMSKYGDAEGKKKWDEFNALLAKEFEFAGYVHGDM